MINDYFKKEYEFLPWNSLTKEEKKEQLLWQRELCENYPVTFGENSVVSQNAFLYQVRGTFGKETLIGSHALLRCLDITCGDNCSFNSYSVIHGKVTLGSGVRIAPGAKIFGENHGFDNISTPIRLQPNTTEGIVIEDDVWIGANAVITDGVRIGAHSIVGAGAVVTKNVEPYSVVGGNPARVIKSRLADMKNSAELKNMVTDFSKKVGENYKAYISYYFDGENYINSKNHHETRRAICDAVEIAGAFNSVPKDIPKDKIIAKIRAFQEDRHEYECVMSASYALEILGEKPICFEYAEVLDPWGFASSLSWKKDAWDAGHNLDIYATACYMNKKHHNGIVPVDLFNWLSLNQNEDGLWGEGDMNLKINGYYRLTRGSFDQFKLKPQRIKEAIDTVLKYAQEKGVPDNACDALDIIHPLYFLGGFTSYRKSEGEAWCVKMLPEFISMLDVTGFPFKKGEETSLKGTEMWLSIIYLMCDYLRLSSLLCYKPKGVHRTNEVTE